MRYGISLLAAAAGLSAAFLHLVPAKKAASYSYAAILGAAFFTTAYQLLREMPGAEEVMRPFRQNFGTMACMAPVGLAFYICAMRGKGMIGMLACGAAFLPFLLMLCTLRNMAALLTASAVCVLLLCFAIFKGWFGGRRAMQAALVLGTAGTFFGLAGYLAFRDPFFATRIEARWNPEADSLGWGYRSLCLRELNRSMRFVGRGEEVRLPGGIDAEEFLEAMNGLELTRLMYRYGWWIGLAAGVLTICAAVGIGLMVFKKAKSLMGRMMGMAVLLPAAVRTLLFFAEILGYGGCCEASLPFFTGSGAELLAEGVCIGMLAAVLRVDAAFCMVEETEPRRRLNYSLIRLMLWLRR